MLFSIVEAYLQSFMQIVGWKVGFGPTPLYRFAYCEAVGGNSDVGTDWESIGCWINVL